MNPSDFQSLPQKSNYWDVGNLASNTPPQVEVCIHGPHLPGTLWICQRRLHPCISWPVRNHSGVHHYDPSEPVSGLWRTKGWGASVPLYYCYSAFERTQCHSSRFLGTPQSPLPKPWSPVHRNSCGDYRFGAAQYLLRRAGVTFQYLCYFPPSLSGNNP